MNDNDLKPLENDRKTKYCYIAADKAFAWAVAALFLLFYDFVIDSRLGLSSSLFMLALYGVTAAYFKKCNVPILRTWYFPLLGCLLSLSFFFTASMNVKPLVFFFNILVYLVWLLYACGNNGNGFDMLWYDCLKAVFVMPFSSLGRMFGAIISGKNGKDRGKRVMLTIGGIAVAVIPTLIVVELLSSADSAFANFVGSLKSIAQDIPQLINRLACAVAFSCFVFGAMYANGRKLYPQSFSKECNEAKRKARALIPETFIYAAATPMPAVYAVFFALQFGYFTSAFSSSLPDGVDNYAVFARNGFFELCVVAVINTAVILFISCFVKRNDGKKPLGARIYCGIYAVASLAFTVIVLAKMVLYIKKFGLTRLRFYTGLFMLLLGVLFVLMLIRELKPSFKFLSGAVVTVSLFALLFAFCHVDGIIARYNVNAYLDGRLNSIDVDMLSSLSDDAYPSLVKLYEEGDDTMRDKARTAIEKFRGRVATHGAGDINISDIIIRVADEPWSE